jgi:hypothetical protein
VSTTVAVDTTPVAPNVHGWVASVSVSTRRLSDMSGLATAGRAVRFQAAPRGLEFERAGPARSQRPGAGLMLIGS